MPGLQAETPQHWERAFSALALKEEALRKSFQKNKNKKPPPTKQKPGVCLTN